MTRFNQIIADWNRQDLTRSNWITTVWTIGANRNGGKQIISDQKSWEWLRAGKSRSEWIIVQRRSEQIESKLIGAYQSRLKHIRADLNISEQIETYQSRLKHIRADWSGAKWIGPNLAKADLSRPRKN